LVFAHVRSEQNVADLVDISGRFGGLGGFGSGGWRGTVHLMGLFGRFCRVHRGLPFWRNTLDMDFSSIEALTANRVGEACNHARVELRRRKGFVEKVRRSQFEATARG